MIRGPTRRLFSLVVAATTGYDGTSWTEGSAPARPGWSQPPLCARFDACAQDTLLVESGRLKREVLPQDPLSPFLIREYDGRVLGYPAHFHPELELTFIRGGSGVRYVGDSIQSFEGGDLCLVGSGTAHRWMSHEKGDKVALEEPDNLFSFVVLQFNPDVFGPGFLELGSAQPLKDLFERAALGASIHGETRRLVADSLEAMLTRRVSPLERVSGLLEALTKIALAPGPEVVTLSSAPTEQPQELKQEQRVKRLISHIGENAAQSLPEKEVAALVGLSPAAFSRFFRRTFGKPFVRYVAEVRVAHACRLLAESTRSIADVAFEVGFNNLANFNRRFRALRGMTPSAYRTLARRMI